MRARTIVVLAAAVSLGAGVLARLRRRGPSTAGATAPADPVVTEATEAAVSTEAVERGFRPSAASTGRGFSLFPGSPSHRSPSSVVSLPMNTSPEERLKPLPPSAPLPRLHDFAASANCFKVRMLLSQLQIPYERVAVDIFAGESQTDSFLSHNPAGRTPLLETEDGSAIPESGAILLYLAEGTPFLPADRVERAHVHAWMFFEQNLLEPNVGTARFWRLTGREGERPEAFARHLEAGAGALSVLERGLTGRDFLVAGRYTVADCALYAYARVAHEAGYEMAAYPAVGAWLGRVAATSGAIDDLEPYPATAHAGAGGRSAHDR